MGRPSSVFVCALSTALLLESCGAGAAPDPPCVLLITLDTARADVLSCRGTEGLTPAICALARASVRFPRAYTVAPLTVPAHASIFTGLYPPRHTVRDNGSSALPSAARTLAEVARAQGLETVAFVSSAVLDRVYALDQGFERYDQPLLRQRTQEDFYLERHALETAETVCEWLEQREERRGFFAWMHLYDAHIPYAAPEEFLNQAGGDAYRGEIAFVDRAVGRVLQKLIDVGVDERTWVVLTSDHGESLGEHGEPTHGALCYEAAMRVPLLFRPPPGVELRPGGVRIASVVDIHPTVRGFLDLEPANGLDGIDLFRSDDATRGVYFESYSGYLNYGWSPLVGWVDPHGKYLHSSEPEFYLSEDLLEDRNLAQQRTDSCESAREKLAALLQKPALPQDRFEAGGDLQRALWTLGYAGAGSDASDFPSALEPSERPAPRAHAVELEPLHRANALVDHGRHAKALPLLQRILEHNPNHLLALDLAGLCRMYAGEFEAAETLLRQRLERGPERADTRLNLGLCLEQRGQFEAARRELERALTLNGAQDSIRIELERMRAAAQDGG